MKLSLTTPYKKNSFHKVTFDKSGRRHTFRMNQCQIDMFSMESKVTNVSDEDHL